MDCRETKFIWIRGVHAGSHLWCFLQSCVSQKTCSALKWVVVTWVCSCLKYEWHWGANDHLFFIVSSLCWDRLNIYLYSKPSKPSLILLYFWRRTSAGDVLSSVFCWYRSFGSWLLICLIFLLLICYFFSLFGSCLFLLVLLLLLEFRESCERR